MMRQNSGPLVVYQGIRWPLFGPYLAPSACNLSENNAPWQMKQIRRLRPIHKGFQRLSTNNKMDKK